MNAPTTTEVSPFFGNQATFEAVVQHWAKARIDTPMQIIAKFDDAAKQLITIGSTLQGLYIAVFTFGDTKGEIPIYLLASLSVPLVLLIACAAQAICAVPLKEKH